MNIDIQFKIKNNPNYLKYIRENSYWYKILTRAPMAFKNFEEEVREAYHLRPMDKIGKALETVEMLQAVMSTLQ